MERLVGAFARTNLGKPFAWGACDCNTLALEWAGELAGVDMLQGIYGEYGTAEEAAAFADAYGQTLTAKIINAGFDFADTAYPRAGDVVVVHGADLIQRGHICVGSGRVLSVDPERGVHLGPVRSLPRFMVLRFKNA